MTIEIFSLLFFSLCFVMNEHTQFMCWLYGLHMSLMRGYIFPLYHIIKLDGVDRMYKILYVIKHLRRISFLWVWDCVPKWCKIFTKCFSFIFTIGLHSDYISVMTYWLNIFYGWMPITLHQESAKHFFFDCLFSVQKAEDCFDLMRCHALLVLFN